MVCTALYQLVANTLTQIVFIIVQRNLTASHNVMALSGEGFTKGQGIFLPMRLSLVPLTFLKKRSAIFEQKSCNDKA